SQHTTANPASVNLPIPASPFGERQPCDTSLAISIRVARPIYPGPPERSIRLAFQAALPSRRSRTLTALPGCPRDLAIAPARVAGASAPRKTPLTSITRPAPHDDLS